VWHLSVGSVAPMRDRFLGLLAPDERARAERFHFEVDRTRYITTRGVLRELLGHYIGRDAAQVVFAYNEHGKPVCAPSTGMADVTFNVSHSGDVALLAFARGVLVGVDVEVVREIPDMAQVAVHSFSPAERAVLNAVAAEHRTLAFLHCWTRKEAVLKGMGCGLSVPLDSFDVTLEPGVRPELLAFRSDPAAVGRWRLYDLPVAAGVVGALAVASSDMVVLTSRYKSPDNATYQAATR
jgi:4'-phosphopantetheinyl transferase